MVKFSKICNNREEFETQPEKLLKINGNNHIDCIWRHNDRTSTFEHLLKQFFIYRFSAYATEFIDHCHDDCHELVCAHF